MLRLSLLAIFAISVSLVFSAPRQQAKATCGYQSCPAVKPDMLNVHLVPHTHDDVGWLKTIDQYFYGSRNNIQVAGVQYIIDSVISELSKDPSRRFIYVETAYFWQWWLEQNDNMRDKVHQLVESGQLEFISGAWSMNDEATTHYQSTIDQFTWGLRKLNDTFGECGRPRIGWQIDPFGHARETASIMARLGFDGLFFARLDYQDKDQRESTNTTELVWRASANLGNASHLFTSVLYYFYSAPPNFCFDIECNDAPIIDNVLSPDYNKDERIDEFIDRIWQQSQYYKSGNIIMAMGGDFNYQQADTWYKNMDKLIKYINEKQANGSTINLLYSTPSCYLKALNDAGLSWSTKDDDFFPYSSDPNAFWTGYFTSRPTLKYFERKGNNLLQVCKQIHALTASNETEWNQIASLREVMGVMQHHDAITGTEKQHVAEDYALRLHQAVADCHETVKSGMNKLMAKGADSPQVTMESCLLANTSSCSSTETVMKFVLTVYNPLGQISYHYVRVPIEAENFQFSVKGPADEVVTFQIVPIPDPVKNIPGRESSATHELVFKAVDLPPLGFKSYFIEKTEAQITQPSFKPTTSFNFGKKDLEVTLDSETRLLKTLRVKDRQADVTQEMMYYTGAVGDNTEWEKRSSGAYIFRPNEDAPTALPNPTTYDVTGDIVDEVLHVFSEWVSQIVRIYHDESYLEVEWLVGPIPVEGEIGKEVITRFTVQGWQTDGKFYTDSNGREMLERVRNFRPTWQLDLKEPVAGNYYPITTAISMNNSADAQKLILLTDRAQGGSSLNDGQLEIMVHRRLMHDDAFGVGEALDEHAHGVPLVARGRHLVILASESDTPSASTLQRTLTLRHMVLPPWILVTETQQTWEEWSQLYTTQWSGLRNPLPDNLHLLTLEPWRADELLLRFEHIFETSEDPVNAAPVSIVIEDLFTNLMSRIPHETTLGANQWIEDSSRLTWNYESAEGERTTQQQPKQHSKTTVQLNPMEIKTFVVKSTPSKGSANANFATFSLILAMMLLLAHVYK